ncbi:MAG: DJ-1/PfpI family protein [Solirubrobacteraceae bacterium]
MRIAIPLFDGFTALDAIGPYEVLSRLPGVELVFVARERGAVAADSGMVALLAVARLEDVAAPDVLVVPGGRGTRRLLDDEHLLGWIRQAHSGSQWTASVCTGSLLLGAAGILVGVRASTHWLEYETLARFGARPVRERVVRDGKIITAAGVSAGIDMALTLAAEIAGEQVASAIQLSIEYDPQPPFHAGSPEKAPAAVREIVEARHRS